MSSAEGTRGNPSEVWRHVGYQYKFVRQRTPHLQEYHVYVDALHTSKMKTALKFLQVNPSLVYTALASSVPSRLLQATRPPPMRRQ